MVDGVLTGRPRPDTRRLWKTRMLRSRSASQCGCQSRSRRMRGHQLARALDGPEMSFRGTTQGWKWHAIDGVENRVKSAAKSSSVS